ncbi:MAG: ammonium transporter [Pirellulaceae bacterium]|nr:ammonium transporter [Pirellulaceae bacterium]
MRYLRRLSSVFLLLSVFHTLCLVPPVQAQDAASAPVAVAPSVEQRLASLEAYIGNGDPTAKDSAGNPAEGVKTAAMGVAGPGHNAWLMTSSALVLFMTLPGLALFYGGLVRKKNVLSVVAQCFGCAGLVTILWVVCGYTLVFGEHPADNPSNSFPWLFGDLKHLFMDGVTSAPDANYCYWISENVFAMFQMMFAIITPALIVGAIAERMKFPAIMLFITLWMFAVYFPLAHMVWGFDGLMNGVWNGTAKIKAIDFAGGTVVHMSSGWSALVLCLMLGPRKGFGKTAMPPHSMVLCAIGTGMLWVGWYGFNAGSALASDGVAANAFTTTTIAAAVASFVWPLIEYIRNGRPSILGFCSGAVAGLVVVTPACGFITVQGALIIGVLAGIVPYLFCTVVKKLFKYDDALDTFGVHAAGGTLGALLTGFLATSDVNANLIGPMAQANGLDKILANGTLWIEQLKAMGLTIAMSVVATVIITGLVSVLVGLRPTAEVEDVGLDLSEHGEAGYEIY